MLVTESRQSNRRSVTSQASLGIRTSQTRGIGDIMSDLDTIRSKLRGLFYQMLPDFRKEQWFLERSQDSPVFASGKKNM
jgi:hypothetical protein